MPEYRDLIIAGANGDENATLGGDYAGRDIQSLDDQPNLSAEEMKARFDALVKTLIVPRFNALLDRLSTNQTLRIEMVRSLVGASEELTDIPVEWVRKDKAVLVMSNDANPKALPKSASCAQDGVVRVFWQTAPSSAVSVCLTVVSEV